MLQTGSQVDLNCDTNGANCTVVTSDMQNEVSPESGSQPSAGQNQGDTDDGSTGTDTMPPSNTPTPSDSGGGTSGSGSSD
jgi:hypothetical protein